MTQRVDPCHRFLPKIATLSKTNGLFVAANLLRKVAVIEIDAEQWCSGFNSQRVKGRNVARDQASIN